MILPDTDAGAALAFAHQAVENVHALRIPHSATQLARQVVTISAGCFTLTQGVTEQDGLRLKQGADNALYQAKTAGKDRALLAEG